MKRTALPCDPLRLGPRASWYISEPGSPPRRRGRSAPASGSSRALGPHRSGPTSGCGIPPAGPSGFRRSGRTPRHMVRATRGLGLKVWNQTSSFLRRKMKTRVALTPYAAAGPVCVCGALRRACPAQCPGGAGLW